MQSLEIKSHWLFLVHPSCVSNDYYASTILPMKWAKLHCEVSTIILSILLIEKLQLELPWWPSG